MSVIKERQWTTTDGTIKSAWVVIYTDGSGKRRLKTFAKNKAARNFQIDTDAAVKAGTHVAESVSVTVSEAASNWFARCEAKKRERAVIGNYKRAMALHVVDYIGDLKLSKLDRPALSKLEDQLRAPTEEYPEGRSANTIKTVFRMLSQMTKDAMRRGHVNRNITHEYNSSDSDASDDKRAEKRAKGRLEVGEHIPSRGEISAIVAALSGRWRAPVLTAIFTGLRSSELRGLRWSAIDFAESEIYVRERVDQYRVMGAPKSIASDRIIPLPSLVVNALKQHKIASTRTRANDLVFISKRDGGPMNHGNLLVEGWHAAQIKAGVVDSTGKAKYTGIHSVRHFYASWLLNAAPEGQGMTMLEAQALLGHSSIQMTCDVYGHLFKRADDSERRETAVRSLLG